jgi:hypothetical protein
VLKATLHRSVTQLRRHTTLTLGFCGNLNIQMVPVTWM